MDVDGDGEQALVGSLSRVTGQMDDLLPDWLENGVESSLRDSEDDVQAVAVAVTVAVPPPPVVVLRDDLDLFYEESEEESDDDDVIHD